jgi:hypothetical protein
MTDQNNADAFNEDVTRFAENSRQNAMRQAEEQFNALRMQILDEWTARRQAIRSRWESARDALNALPEQSPDESPKQAAARQSTQAEFDAARADSDRMEARGGPNCAPAYAQRDKAVRAADSEYHNTVAALRTKHGVVAPQPVGTR